MEVSLSMTEKERDRWGCQVVKGNMVCTIEAPRFPTLNCAAGRETINAFPVLPFEWLFIQDGFPADGHGVQTRCPAAL